MNLMESKYKIFVWVASRNSGWNLDDWEWAERYSGDSFELALSSFLEAKKSGISCVRLEVS